MTGPGGRAAAGLCPVLSSAGSWSLAGVGDQAAGQTVHVECRALCSRLCCSPSCPLGSSAHALPNAELLRVRQGASLTQSGRLDCFLHHTFYGISWTQAHLLRLPDRELPVGVGWRGPFLSPALDWPRTGTSKTSLAVKSQLLPPPQSRQVSARVTLHKHGKSLEEMGLTFSNGPQPSIGVYLLYCLKNHIQCLGNQNKRPKTTEAALSEL